MDFTGLGAAEKAHAVLVPFVTQGHITPMLQLGKLLHSKGLHITYVLTERNRDRLVRSCGPDAVKGLPDFRFEAIPDALPPSYDDADEDVVVHALCKEKMSTCLPPFRKLVANIQDSGAPPVTCIIVDGGMSVLVDVAEELAVPGVFFWTTSACGFMGYLHYKELLCRGLLPVKDESDLSNGYLDTEIDWIPGMNHLRLKDIPTFIRSKSIPDDVMVKLVLYNMQCAARASAIVLNTFHELESSVLEAMAAMVPTVYTIGPLLLRSRQLPATTAFMGSSLRKEDAGCLRWLEGRAPASVVYVNFGTSTTMTREQLVEFAWGLAQSNHDFLWVVREGLVKGEFPVLPEEFLAQTKGKGLLANWCQQETVLAHPTVGAFLTHSGWNSTLESISSGVPMICWPFFAEQQTNCRYSCTDWGIGVEIDHDVRRDGVKDRINEVMEGTKKGAEMRKRALEWKASAARATSVGGSSCIKLERLLKDLSI
ncbi:hypothetical protein Taro_005028, partial [Colocasia esculenta]|nr:hypothetical protein [Colocasia esculenta]